MTKKSREIRPNNCPQSVFSHELSEWEIWEVSINLNNYEFIDRNAGEWRIKKHKKDPIRLASVSPHTESSNSIGYRHNKQKITFDKWLYMVKPMKLVIAIFALFSTRLFEEEKKQTKSLPDH